MWWIDTFRQRRGEHYRYSLIGRNGMRNDEVIYWHVPTIMRQPYAFALRLVN